MVEQADYQPALQWFDVGGGHPLVAKGIQQARCTIAVELVGGWPERGRAGLDRALVHRVAIVDIQVETAGLESGDSPISSTALPIRTAACITRPSCWKTSISWAPKARFRKSMNGSAFDGCAKGRTEPTPSG